MSSASHGRRLQVVLVVLQTAVLLLVVGNVAALTLPGEWLAVLLPAIGSVLAAATRQPTAVVPVGVVALLAASAAGLGVVLLAVLGGCLLCQVVLAEEPAVVAVPSLVAAAMLGSAVAAGAALLLTDAPRPPSWLAVTGTATLAALLVLALLRGPGSGAR